MHIPHGSATRRLSQMQRLIWAGQERPRVTDLQFGVSNSYSGRD